MSLRDSKILGRVGFIYIGDGSEIVSKIQGAESKDREQERL